MYKSDRGRRQLSWSFLFSGALDIGAFRKIVSFFKTLSLFINTAIMRLYLLPISTRRTLLYCQKFNTNQAEAKTYVDKTTAWAAKTWASWEKKESGWQKTIVNYGNQAFRRIPYEEWGLKSVPPLSTRRREEELSGKDKVDVVFPETVIPASRALGILQTLATERSSLHKQRLIWCIVGMPISAPFALVPV